MPDEGLGVVGPVRDPGADRGDELADGAVGAAAEPLVGELGEPALDQVHPRAVGGGEVEREPGVALRSEEHTSELQSLMRISYAVFCLKKKKKTRKNMNQKTLRKDSNKK